MSTSIKETVNGRSMIGQLSGSDREVVGRDREVEIQFEDLGVNSV